MATRLSGVSSLPAVLLAAHNRKAGLPAIPACPPILKQACLSLRVCMMFIDGKDGGEGPREKGGERERERERERDCCYYSRPVQVLVNQHPPHLHLLLAIEGGQDHCGVWRGRLLVLRLPSLRLASWWLPLCKPYRGRGR